MKGNRLKCLETGVEKKLLLLLTFAAVFAFPSYSQNVLGTGRPLMTAGILIVVPARQESKSCAPRSRKISGSSAKIFKYINFKSY